jgi:YD repeat-containing protein
VTTSYTWNPRGLMTSQLSVPSGQSYSSWYEGMKYDLSGNPTTYPAPGNQTATLALDAESHLTGWTPQTGTPVSFGYDGDGLRAWKQVGTSPSGRTYCLYDGGQPVVELDSTGTVLKAANTFGANGLLSRNVSGTSAFYTFDPQGSVCQRLDRTGNLLSSNSYDAWGGTVQHDRSGVSNVFGYGAQ